MHRFLMALFILFLIYSLGVTQLILIPNVPDHSQPPDTSLPSTKLDRSNYCAPFAYVNIIDYWENVYIHRNASGMMGGLPAEQTVEYIGWFLDTNDNGDPARMNGTDPVLFPPAAGTYTIDQSMGMSNYVLFEPANPLGFPFAVPPLKMAHAWPVSPPLPEDFPGYMGEIDMGRPVKLDFLYWNPIPTGDTLFLMEEPIDTVIMYKWGPQIPNTAGMDDTPFEEWNLEMDPERGIGHAVTGVGFIMDTSEFAIVHDNWSSTAKNMAIPWRDMQTGIPYVTAMIYLNPPPDTLKTSLPDTTVKSGETILIPIIVDDLTGLHVTSYFSNVLFDTTALQATGATSVNSLSSAWGAPMVTQTTPGEIIVESSGSIELSGDGNLVFLEFQAKESSGDTSRLQFKTMAFNLGDPVADTSSGSLIVLPKKVDVTISSNPAGLSIDVDGAPVTTPHAFTWNFGDMHQLNALSPQIITQGTRHLYDFWSDGMAQQHIITVPDRDTSFTAHYLTEFELITAVNPPQSGTITIVPNQSWFFKDSVVVLTAVPDTGYFFAGWSGDLTGNNNPDSLTMNSPKNVTANFNIINDLSEKVSDKIPEVYALKQNYPNPFNPKTVISWQLPLGGMVNLTVYNLQGQKVATLMNKQQPAGSHSIEFDASQLASGVYLYRLQAGRYIETKKMLLLR